MYEIKTELAVVRDVLSSSPVLQIVLLKLRRDGQEGKGINYPVLSGSLKKGEEVLVNSTARELKLGTGGYHFIISRCSKGNNSNNGSLQQPGHIMKLRYTPFQLKTLSVEEKASPYHQQIKNFNDLKGQPVIIIPLHSLLAPLAAVFNFYYPGKKLVYIMTEGGSLALNFSFQVKELVDRGYIYKTITIGHSFGGDFEAVNIITGLAAARIAAEADLIVVGMGPGIVGTATRFGFSGVENVFINQSINILKGKSIMVPRVSFAEKRSRHNPVSHHTLTMLTDMISNPVEVIFPDIKELKYILQQAGLLEKHQIIFYNQDQYDKIERVLRNSDLKFNSMGRSFKEDPLFFITGGLPVLRFKELQKE